MVNLILKLLKHHFHPLITPLYFFIKKKLSFDLIHHIQHQKALICSNTLFGAPFNGHEGLSIWYLLS